MVYERVNLASQSHTTDKISLRIKISVTFDINYNDFIWFLYNNQYVNLILMRTVVDDTRCGIVKSKICQGDKE
jgi:hypothetical protein